MSEKHLEDYFGPNSSDFPKDGEMDYKLSDNIFKNDQSCEPFQKSENLDKYQSDSNASTEESSVPFNNNLLLKLDPSDNPKEGMRNYIELKKDEDNKTISILEENKPKVDNMKRMFLTKFRQSLHLTILKDILGSDKTKFKKIPDEFKDPKFEKFIRNLSKSLKDIYIENHIDVKAYLYHNQDFMNYSIKELAHKYFNHINFVVDLYEISKKLSEKFSSEYAKEYLIYYIGLVKSLIAS